MKRITLPALGAVAALAVGATAALAAVETGTYAGTTTQVEAGMHGKVKLVVSSPHKLKLFKYQFHASCQKHKVGYGNTFAAHNGPINDKGHFQDLGLFTFAGPQGSTAHAKVAIVGDFTTPGHVMGSFGVKITFINPDGTTQDKCSTGVIDWHAKLA